MIAIMMVSNGVVSGSDGCPKEIGGLSTFWGTVVSLLFICII